MGEAGMVVDTFSEEVGMGNVNCANSSTFFKKSFLFWIDFRLPKRCHRHTNEYK